MYKGLPQQGKELLDTEEVAAYLGVGQVTVWRWCREGSLPCLKIGREWRIRREALERFLERSERSETLVGRLRSFLEVPDNVLAVAQDREMMHRLDTAFFRVGEAQGGRLIKYVGGESWDSLDEVRTTLERCGLEVGRLEEEGRLRFTTEPDPQGGRSEELRRLISEEADGGRSVWGSSTGPSRLGWKRRSTNSKPYGRSSRKVSSCSRRSCWRRWSTSGQGRCLDRRTFCTRARSGSQSLGWPSAA